MPADTSIAELLAGLFLVPAGAAAITAAVFVLPGYLLLLARARLSSRRAWRRLIGQDPEDGRPHKEKKP